MIDHKAEGGKQLHALIKRQLLGYLDYSNDVLPLYIVVMLAKGFSEAKVAQHLEAFLGSDAGRFAQWIFRHLADNPGEYDVANGAMGASGGTRADSKCKEPREEEEHAQAGMEDASKRGPEAALEEGEVPKKRRSELLEKAAAATHRPFSSVPDNPWRFWGASSPATKEFFLRESSNTEQDSAKETKPPFLMTKLGLLECQICGIITPDLRRYEEHCGWGKHAEVLDIRSKGGDYCLLCKVFCPSRTTYLAHLAGKPHLKRQLRVKGKPGGQKGQSVSRPRGKSYHCGLCNVPLQSPKAITAHMAGKKHRAAERRAKANNAKPGQPQLSANVAQSS